MAFTSYVDCQDIQIFLVNYWLLYEISALLPFAVDGFLKASLVKVLCQISSDLLYLTD